MKLGLLLGDGGGGSGNQPSITVGLLRVCQPQVVIFGEGI
jgi:hypothetical protein